MSSLLAGRGDGVRDNWGSQDENGDAEPLVASRISFLFACSMLSFGSDGMVNIGGGFSSCSGSESGVIHSEQG